MNILFVLLSISFFLIESHQQQHNCPSSQCLANATCNPPGQCQCKHGTIFNCTTNATPLTQNNNTSANLLLNIPEYYILNSSIGNPLYYSITITSSQIDTLWMQLQIQLYIDNGVGISPDYPPATQYQQTGEVDVLFEVTLNSIEGINQSQQLIMMLNYTGLPNNSTGSIQVLIQYSYETDHYTNLFLILGYVAGGILLGVTIFLMVIIYRKRRAETQERNQRQQNKQPQPFDISHFSVAMPASTITVQDKKQGKTCSVCLVELDFNSQVRTTICGHIFHADCIDQWCLKNLTCPICRTDLSSANIMKMRFQNTRRKGSWVMNTFNQDDQDNEEATSQVREPLNNYIICNHQL